MLPFRSLLSCPSVRFNFLYLSSSSSSFSFQQFSLLVNSFYITNTLTILFLYYSLLSPVSFRSSVISLGVSHYACVKLNFFTFPISIFRIPPFIFHRFSVESTFPLHRILRSSVHLKLFSFVNLPLSKYYFLVFIFFT